MARLKVVHLHLKEAALAEKDYYFGSFAAMYEQFPSEAIGIEYQPLTDALRVRGFYENDRCSVRVGRLVAKKRKNMSK